MKILFWGLGGAGQRHLRCFSKLVPDAELLSMPRVKKTPLLTENFQVQNNLDIADVYGLEVMPDNETAWSKSPDLTVISVPSSLQAEYAAEAVQHGQFVLLEKPGVADIQSLTVLEQSINKHPNKIILCFQSQFKPIFIELRSSICHVEICDLFSINVNVATDVSKWHIYERHQDLYACRKDLGGGVIRQSAMNSTSY